MRTGSLTGGGIYAKLALVRVGGEISHKVNREVVLLVDHPAVYAHLAALWLMQAATRFRVDGEEL